MKQDFKPLALVVGGSLIASIISFLLGLKYLYAAILIVIVGFSFAYGLGILQAALKRYRQHHRWRNIRVGILYDICWNIESSHARTDVTPEEWTESLLKYLKEGGVNPKIEFTEVTSKLEKYSAILNPYGSVYPEIDLENLESLHKILEYVNEGGLFISVADMPFYYAYNNRVRKRISQQPSSFRFFRKKIWPYLLNPFSKNVGLEFYNLDDNGNTSPAPFPLCPPEDKIEVVCRRGAQIDENVKSHMRIKPDRGGKGIEYSPLFSAYYGAGEFLISTIWISGDENQGNVRSAVVRVICTLIQEKLKKLILDNQTRT